MPGTPSARARHPRTERPERPARKCPLHSIRGYDRDRAEAPHRRRVGRNGRLARGPSPYDGSPVGRVAKGGSAEASAAIDAAQRAMAEPLPAHERAAILDRTARLVEERAEEIARTISAEAGKPMKAARIEAARATSTFTMAAVEARKLAGDVVPMDASPAGAGKLALTLRLPSASSGRSRPSTSPSTSSRTRSRRRWPRAARSC